MTRYLFYNIYGDADDLVKTAPADVVLVPFGWTPEIEEARNAILAHLGATVSCLPSLIYNVPQTEKFFRSYGVVEERNRNAKYIVPAQWKEVRIGDLPKPWTWEAIETKRKEQFDRDTSDERSSVSRAIDDGPR